MAGFADEINQMMEVPSGAPTRSLAQELDEQMSAAPTRAGGSPLGYNLLGLGQWVAENPGQATEIIAQFVMSGVGMAAGAPGGPPGMATGAAIGNTAARQGVRAVRRMMGATAEEAPLADPVEMAADLATGAAGNVVRPLARMGTGTRLGGQGALYAPHAAGPRTWAADSAEHAASSVGQGLRKIGEIGGLGSAIAGQPVLGAAIYLGSHAAEPVYRRAAERLLNNQGFHRWISERPGLSWYEAVTDFSAMSADNLARYGMGADVRDAMRILADTLGETIGPASAQQTAGADGPVLAPRPPVRQSGFGAENSPFANVLTVVETPGGPRGRNPRTGQFQTLGD